MGRGGAERKYALYGQAITAPIKNRTKSKTWSPANVILWNIMHFTCRILSETVLKKTPSPIHRPKSIRYVL